MLFALLAQGHANVMRVLDSLRILASEGEVCKAVVSLTAENPQNPPTGAKLWDRLQAMFPNQVDLVQAVQNRLDELKGLQAHIQARGLPDQCWNGSEPQRAFSLSG